MGRGAGVASPRPETQRFCQGCVRVLAGAELSRPGRTCLPSPSAAPGNCASAHARLGILAHQAPMWTRPRPAGRAVQARSLLLSKLLGIRWQSAAPWSTWLQPVRRGTRRRSAWPRLLPAPSCVVLTSRRSHAGGPRSWPGAPFCSLSPTKPQLRA